MRPPGRGRRVCDRILAPAPGAAPPRPPDSLPFPFGTGGNILVALFAILLCLVNAVVWTVVSEMPVAGVGWLIAAVFCFWLQKWSKG